MYLIFRASWRDLIVVFFSMVHIFWMRIVHLFFWDDFMKSYNGIFINTQKAFDWINVPADKKWQKDYIVLKHVNKYFKEIL